MTNKEGKPSEVVAVIGIPDDGKSTIIVDLIKKILYQDKLPRGVRTQVWDNLEILPEGYGIQDKDLFLKGILERLQEFQPPTSTPINYVSFEGGIQVAAKRDELEGSKAVRFEDDYDKASVRFRELAYAALLGQQVTGGITFLETSAVTGLRIPIRGITSWNRAGESLYDVAHHNEEFSGLNYNFSLIAAAADADIRGVGLRKRASQEGGIGGASAFLTEIMKKKMINIVTMLHLQHVIRLPEDFFRDPEGKLHEALGNQVYPYLLKTDLELPPNQTLTLHNRWIKGFRSTQIDKTLLQRYNFADRWLLENAS